MELEYEITQKQEIKPSPFWIIKPHQEHFCF